MKSFLFILFFLLGIYCLFLAGCQGQILEDYQSTQSGQPNNNAVTAKLLFAPFGSSLIEQGDEIYYGFSKSEEENNLGLKIG